SRVQFVSDTNLGAAGASISFGGFGSAELVYAGSGAVTVSRPMSIDATAHAFLSAGQGMAAMTVSGNITGLGELWLGAFNTDGEKILTGNNTYSGMTTF